MCSAHTLTYVYGNACMNKCIQKLALFREKINKDCMHFFKSFYQVFSSSFRRREKTA